MIQMKIYTSVTMYRMSVTRLEKVYLSIIFVSLSFVRSFISSIFWSIIIMANWRKSYYRVLLLFRLPTLNDFVFTVFTIANVSYTFFFLPQFRTMSMWQFAYCIHRRTLLWFKLNLIGNLETKMYIYKKKSPSILDDYLIYSRNAK